MLAGFYGRLTSANLAPDEYRRRCFEHVQDNRRELLAAAHHLPERLIKRIHATQLQCLTLHGDLFDQRAAEGKIIEGHGDLRPEHVCLAEPPAIFDCLEFNENLRTLDVADDLAFLVEECDHLGAMWVGQRLTVRFRQLTGDRLDPRLWAFYKSYRACVRAKVTALRADQVADASRDRELAQAKSYLELAEGYLRFWQRPWVVVVGGLSGTGKTTLAVELARRLGADLLRTDVVRQQVYGAGNAPADIDDGIYRPEHRQRVYGELLARAAALHHERVPVILDGTFDTAAQLQAAREIVAHPRGRFLAVECVCPPEVARRRIRSRVADRRDASQASLDVFERQRGRWETWPEDFRQCRIDSEQPPEAQVAQVARCFATCRPKASAAGKSISDNEVVRIEENSAGRLRVEDLAVNRGGNQTSCFQERSS